MFISLSFLKMSPGIYIQQVLLTTTDLSFQCDLLKFNLSLKPKVINTNYTLFHEFLSTFFFNKISLPERRNIRKSVLEITKMYYFYI